jgi:tryptophanyl-tRNA synthetase
VEGQGGQEPRGASVALFTYPVLQAADVLLYQATHVPVGEDQKQHLELARDVAQKFNNDFASEDAPVFTLPDPIIPPQAARIMSLRDGSAKMSKSDPSDMSRINLVDDADTIMAKIKKAKTDPEPLPETAEGLEGRPEARNLVGIYATMAGTDVASVLAQFGGQGFGQFKPALGDLLVEKLAPMAARYRELREDQGALDAILRKGAEKRAHWPPRRSTRPIRRSAWYADRLAGQLAGWPATLPNSEGRPCRGRPFSFESTFLRIFSGVYEYHSNSVQPLASFLSPC